jgi:PRC-barrel domain
MKRLILSLVLACAASSFAYAQEQAAQPDPNAEHPPTNRMDAATPTMKAPDGAEQTAPTNRVGEAVPTMKPDDKSSDTAASPASPPASDTAQSPPSAPSDTMNATAEPAAPAPTFVLSEEAAKSWIGRPVYSIDDKNLGEVAALQRDGNGAVSAFDADIGGFLGFGETRVRLTTDQIQDVKDDKLVLKLTKDEAEALPPVEKN